MGADTMGLQLTSGKKRNQNSADIIKDHVNPRGVVRMKSMKLPHFQVFPLSILDSSGMLDISDT